MSDQFVWDESKYKSNFKKHGVSFEEAKTCFYDFLHVLITDPEHSFGEQRMVLVGVSAKSRLLVVVHVDKSENVIRIISARKASKNERIQYEEV
ncbi:MAG: BrnT family toxin [Bdellovibrionales bacterium]